MIDNIEETYLAGHIEKGRLMAKINFNIESMDSLKQYIRTYKQHLEKLVTWCNEMEREE